MGEISCWLELMGISTKDVGELFNAVDDGDGLIDCREFLKGFSRLQGQATAVDIVSLKNTVKKLGLELSDMNTQIESLLLMVPRVSPSDEDEPALTFQQHED